MKKFGFVLAAVAAIVLGSMTSKPAQADPVTVVLVGGGLGWGYCHATYKKGVKRKTALCTWHDQYHARYWKK